MLLETHHPCFSLWILRLLKKSTLNWLSSDCSDSDSQLQCLHTLFGRLVLISQRVRAVQHILTFFSKSKCIIYIILYVLQFHYAKCAFSSLFICYKEFASALLPRRYTPALSSLLQLSRGSWRAQQYAESGCWLGIKKRNMSARFSLNPNWEKEETIRFWQDGNTSTHSTCTAHRWMFSSGNPGINLDNPLFFLSFD